MWSTLLSRAVTDRVVVARVIEVRCHPNAERIWVAWVDFGQDEPAKVVFGGPPLLVPGDKVPYAPPGARLPGRKKMRRRRYRGVDSYGMFCSLAELGWDPAGPDEVVLLQNDLEPGKPLDVVDWRTVVREPGESAHRARQLHAILQVGDRRYVLPLASTINADSRRSD